MPASIALVTGDDRRANITRALELIAPEVDLRGRPALDAMPDFHDKVARTKNVAFHGAYRNPEDIGTIYGQVHFSWVIDFYEEGQNSQWLLPNRLYEGCRFGAVPVAMK